MTSPITPADLAHWEALCERATKGVLGDPEAQLCVFHSIEAGTAFPRLLEAYRELKEKYDALLPTIGY